jgi:nitroreductase
MVNMLNYLLLKREGMRINQTVKLLLGHASVRKYQDKEVGEEMVEAIVQCAQRAPTSSHLQAYTIIEVRDEEKREILSGIADGQKWVKEAPLVLLFCADLHRGREYLVLEDKGVFGNTDLFMVAVADAALAAQNALIAARSMGLGGVFVGGH